MPRMTLLVIDMLNDFFEQHASLASQRPALVTSINALAEEFRRRDQPVIWIRQEFAPDLHDAFLDMRKHGLRITIAGTKGCELLSELDRRPGDQVIVKKRYSAFFGTGLDATLEGARTGTLVIAGINSHACVRTTAIDAFQRDYDVVVARDCIASYDQEHHDVTTRYLGRAIARLLPNQDIVEMLAS
jgi:nicotinamidase-related amidase